jgi:hypothetical protein
MKTFFFFRLCSFFRTVGMCFARFSKPAHFYSFGATTQFFSEVRKAIHISSRFSHKIGKMLRSNQTLRRASNSYLYLKHRFSSNQASTKKYAKTFAGSGTIGADQASSSMIPRGPVSWVSLGLVAVAAASAASYYQIERERRLENAMGKIVRVLVCWIMQ